LVAAAAVGVALIYASNIQLQPLYLLSLRNIASDIFDARHILVSEAEGSFIPRIRTTYASMFC